MKIFYYYANIENDSDPFHYDINKIKEIDIIGKPDDYLIGRIKLRKCTFPLYKIKNNLYLFKVNESYNFHKIPYKALEETVWSGNEHEKEIYRNCGYFSEFE